MKILSLLSLLALTALGCENADRGATDRGNTTINDSDRGAIDRGNTTITEGDRATTDRDNTAVNERDRSDAAKTPLDQNENQKDIDITANIRKQVVDSDLSVNAQNVKIITQDGNVTLRGPVGTADEKMRIEAIARKVAGETQVTSELEVAE